jgi:ribosome-dependent ATPase
MRSEARHSDLAVDVSGLHHRYKSTAALGGVSLTLPIGSDTALIGPDGVGKSTLLGLIAGARIIQQGRIDVFGGNMADAGHRGLVAPRIAFMPQGLGKNLYPSLSVTENIDFFASLYATSEAERTARREQLLHATGLDPFPDRPAGKLSGGMRQKLSLCCALVHQPDLLILDEPTTGIDPLSRRQFWQLIDGFRLEQPTLTLLVATAYMEEAERFSQLIAMDAGRILAAGPVAELVGRAGVKTVEEAYVAMRHPGQSSQALGLTIPPRTHFNGLPAIIAEDLTCRFGDFVAVDAVSFRIERGEIFGFLGSNGCGKTTTMKMLTGLLPATDGRAELLGQPVDATDPETRRRVGYMSQSFSLYGELTVRANLNLHAKLYRLDPATRGARIVGTLERFDLAAVADDYPAGLPLGVRQRLQLAVACLHGPEVLILDEPTSGVDPEARDRFWNYLVELSRRDGVTIFISTHFMNEAERCDRVSFMHAGKVLAVGTPVDLRRAEHAGTFEAAFISCLEKYIDATSRRDNQFSPQRPLPVPPLAAASRRSGSSAWVTWVMAFARREAREVVRDRVRLGVAFLAPLVLLVALARGISFDIESLPFSVFDRDQSVESRSLTLHLAGSRYFAERRPIVADNEVDRHLQSGEATLVVEIPPGFGRALLRGHKPMISLWLDGANPARANTARGYAEGITQSFIAQFARQDMGVKLQPLVNIEPRFLYNQDFLSVFAIAPGCIMLLLLMSTSMMTALGVVREREIGSIINLAVSPATTGSFLVGKLLPYVVIGAINLLLMVLITVFSFGVPVKGSLIALALGGVLYVIAAAAFGIFVSTFVRSQVAAIFVCAILSLLPALNFSGFMHPISNLSPEARIIGLVFPSSWFQRISMGVFNKGLPFNEFIPPLIALAMFPVVYLLMSRALLKKQER